MVTPLTITVPASTANIGPGFDSAGMALSRYLTLHVKEHSQWIFEHRSIHLPEAPAACEHLIYQIAERTAKQYGAVLPSCKVVVESEIPLTRGLGSSASAVIAGIELANQLCSLSLSQSEKLDCASDFEGHPDNVAAALLGGLVISAPSSEGKIEFFQKKDDNLEIIVYIPNFELKTEAARKVLPDVYSRNDAAVASAIGNVMFAALIAGDYELAGRMMERDLFHEPHRASLIPNYVNIRREARNFGAYGTVISGAGPTMMSLVPKGNGEKIAALLQEQLPDYEVEVLAMDLHGLRVESIVQL
ncbi:homoserine kinase [Lederbergia citrea]|uniref:Homoserine kinase n=1 Tax=Lederbergia citrea TaxID=2833581 RepID=A0A942Z6R5_9BACI|nr:homoserine kinase [Lederbergia citrea]MBS4179321.1 homoserine kinase [Lederbergia citrea]MBS4205989.1 homoserine kinase [Lederbergia citrea]MBS4224562.1 homoserine kinase [Lederbergia citrea]